MKSPQEVAKELVKKWAGPYLPSESMIKDLTEVLRAERSVLAEKEKNRCEHCGAKSISFSYMGKESACPGCGAPICCPQCCKINNLETKLAEKDELIERLRIQGGWHRVDELKTQLSAQAAEIKDYQFILNSDVPYGVMLENCNAKIKAQAQVIGRLMEGFKIMWHLHDVYMFKHHSYCADYLNRKVSEQTDECICSQRKDFLKARQIFEALPAESEGEEKEKA